LSTKIHAAVDALGNPVRLVLTPGQASEYGAAPALLDGFSPQAVLGDKGYDSTALRDLIQAVGAEPVIPPKKNRLARIEVDWHCYQDRNLVESSWAAPTWISSAALVTMPSSWYAKLQRQ
jgi:transposase